jgi:heme/copper-type cytochrome/quinol oxidase subunit 3
MSDLFILLFVSSILFLSSFYCSLAMYIRTDENKKIIIKLSICYLCLKVLFLSKVKIKKNKTKQKSRKTLGREC